MATPRPALAVLQPGESSAARNEVAFLAAPPLAGDKVVCPPTFSGNVLDVDLVFVRHVTEDGEDGEPGDKAGDTVDGAGQQGVPGGKKCC